MSLAHLWKHLLKGEFGLPEKGSLIDMLKDKEYERRLYITCKYTQNCIQLFRLLDISLLFHLVFKKNPFEMIETIVDILPISKTFANTLNFLNNVKQKDLCYIFMSSFPETQKIVFWKACINLEEKAGLSLIKYLAIRSFDHEENPLTLKKARFFDDGKFYIIFKENVLRIYNLVNDLTEAMSGNAMETYELEITYKESTMIIQNSKKEQKVFEYSHPLLVSPDWSIKESSNCPFTFIFENIGHLLIVLDSKQTKIVKIMRLFSEREEFSISDIWVSPQRQHDSFRVYLVDNVLNIYLIDLKPDSNLSQKPESIALKPVFEREKHCSTHSWRSTSSKHFEFLSWKKKLNSDEVDACVLILADQFYVVDLESGFVEKLIEVKKNVSWHINTKVMQGWVVSHNFIIYVMEGMMNAISLYSDYFARKKLLGKILGSSFLEIVKLPGTLAVLSKDKTTEILVRFVNPYYFHANPINFEKPKVEEDGAVDLAGLFDTDWTEDNDYRYSYEVYGIERDEDEKIEVENMANSILSLNNFWAPVEKDPSYEGSDEIRVKGSLIFYRQFDRLFFIDLLQKMPFIWPRRTLKKPVETEKQIQEKEAKPVNYLKLHKKLAPEEAHSAKSKESNNSQTKTALKKELKGLPKEEKEQIKLKKFAESEDEDEEEKEDAKFTKSETKLSKYEIKKNRKVNAKVHDQALSISKKSMKKRVTDGLAD